MTFSEFESFVSLAKISHKDEKNKIINECICYINSSDYKCYCKYLRISEIDSKLLEHVLIKCKNVCNLCQFHVDKKLNKFLKIISYEKICRIFSFEYLSNSSELSEHYLKFIETIQPSEILLLIKKHGNINLSTNFIKYILETIKKTNYSSTTIWFELFKTISKNEKHLEFHNQLLMSFIYEIIENNKLSNFSKTDLDVLMKSDYLINFAIKKNKITNLEIIIDSCSSIFIDHSLIKELIFFDYFLQKKICKKMINCIDFVSYNNRYYAKNQTIDLIVKPKNILSSIFTENDQHVIDMLSDRYNTYIIYRTELGDVGADAGGLTKDFYSNIGIELGKNSIEIDGFLIPTFEKLNKKEMRLLGILLCRSIFFHNISPNLNIHPIVVYFLINGGSNININDMIKFIKYHDIDYLNNLFKIMNFSKEDYTEFLNLEEHGYMSKESYIKNVISKKYISENLIALTNGFCYMSKNLLHCKSIELSVLHKFITKNEKYNIKNHGIHSLKNNLTVTLDSCLTDSFEESMRIEKSEIFKNIFIDILEDFNNNDIDKLRSFFKFWYGTSSVMSFTERSSKINIFSKNRSNLNCFESSTCFDKLYISIVNSMYKNKNSLKSYIISAIESSIENQKRCESIGFYMQYM